MTWVGLENGLAQWPQVGTDSSSSSRDRAGTGSCQGLPQCHSWNPPAPPRKWAEGNIDLFILQRIWSTSCVTLRSAGGVTGTGFGLFLVLMAGVSAHFLH